MNAADLPDALGMELKRRKYFVHMDVLEQTLSLVKIRLYISPDLFVQVYRNDRYQTTNLVLIHNGHVCLRGTNWMAAGTGTRLTHKKNMIKAKREENQ